MNNPHASLQPTVLQTAPYSSRPPSPPYIHVPPPVNPNLTHPMHNHTNFTNLDDPNDNNPNGIGDIIMTIHPSPTAVHTTGLSPADLHAITRSQPQSARDGASAWVYESRRRAQMVLDYLYLGPASAVKDREFLVREGITMVLCARDARFVSVGSGTDKGEGMLVGGVKRNVEGLGVEVEGVDVVDGRELVSAFGVVVRRVNEHVLKVQRESNGERRGKVLVVCETGNDRSAAVVAAYLMAVYGLDTVQAVQFMQLQRFCVAMGDEIKFQLQAYGDILRARGDVGVTGQQRQGTVSGGGIGPGPSVKRRVEETMEGAEGKDGQEEMMAEMDDERYAGRNFAPFVERGF